MKLFPYEEFSIKTKTSEQEVIAKLSEITIDSNEFFQFRLNYSGKQFRGEIYGNKFNLKPKGSAFSKRSMIPVITGEVTSDSESTIITGQIELNLFMRIVFPMIYILSIPLFYFYLRSFASIPLVLFVALLNYVIISVTVKNHTSNSIQILSQL